MPEMPEMPEMEQPIFLVGPPGSGKTTLGKRVCAQLDLTFVDLPADAPAGLALECFGDVQRAIAHRAAGVVTLPWALQDRNALLAARKAGTVVLLWAHPEEMQARSGFTEPLFTPNKGLKTRGGFGRGGTRCAEFRRLARASHETLLVVGLDPDEAAAELVELIADIRGEASGSPAEREGLLRWVEHWRADCHADRRAATIVVDAMARYTLHLKSQGASPRTLSGVYSDLDAAGMLVMMYDAPKGQDTVKVLRHFAWPPHEFEYQRKFSDSASAVSRYNRTLEGFGEFLRVSGLLPA